MTALYTVFVVALLAAPFLVGAQLFDERAPADFVLTADTFYQVISDIFVFLYSVFFAVAAVFILWAGYVFLRAGGNPDKVEEAKNRLLYAVVAIAVAFLTLGLDNLVQSLLLGTGF